MVSFGAMWIAVGHFGFCLFIYGYGDVEYQMNCLEKHVDKSFIKIGQKLQQQSHFIIFG